MSENKYKTVISIDCMGGDLGEQEVLKGIIKAYKENNSLFLNFFENVSQSFLKYVRSFRPFEQISKK